MRRKNVIPNRHILAYKFFVSTSKFRKVLQDLLAQPKILEKRKVDVKDASHFTGESVDRKHFNANSIKSHHSLFYDLLIIIN